MSPSPWKTARLALGLRVWGLRFGVWALGFGVWGLEFRVGGPNPKPQTLLTQASEFTGLLLRNLNQVTVIKTPFSLLYTHVMVISFRV